MNNFEEIKDYVSKKEWRRPDVTFTPETYHSHLNTSDTEFFESVLDHYSKILRTKGEYRQRPFVRIIGGRIENTAWQTRAWQMLTSQTCYGNLCKLAQDVICERFGEDALTNYGIPDDILLDSFPAGTTVLQKENYLFMHNNILLDAMIKAPKIPVEPWQSCMYVDGTEFFTQRCIMNIDGQILLAVSSIYPEDKSGKAKSGIGFNVFFRGNRNGCFRVEKWDFEPISQELNRYLERDQVYFFKEGIVPENTRYSHIHKRTVRQRIVCGSGFYGDLRPTPINKNPYLLERRFNSFKDMVNCYLDRCNISSKVMDEELLNSIPLKEIGLMYCPRFDSQLDKVVPSEFHAEECSEYFEPYTCKPEERFNVNLDSYQIEEDWSPMQEAGQQTLRFTGLMSKESRYLGRLLWEQRRRNNDMDTEIPGLGQLR